MSSTQIEIVQGEAIEMVPPMSNKRDGLPANKTPSERAPQDPNAFDRGTILKLLSSGFCFFVAGTNDGSIGALIPYVIHEYHINNAIVSSV